MKTHVFIIAAAIGISSCSNNSSTMQVQRIKDLAREDSVRAVDAAKKDSMITAYLDDLNEIQENLDRIKQREKIITMNPAELNSTNKQSIVAEVKELDDWIVINDKKMNTLEARLRGMDTKNNKLESLVTHLKMEIQNKDEEIGALQSRLGKADDSIKYITARFNDSIAVIKRQRSEMSQQNTVYYVTGTIKQLKEKGVIDKEGGFIGLGRVAELNPNLSSTLFMKADLSNLKGINLHGKFRRFITTHPDKAYRIVSKTKADSINITQPSSFWSESRYLVVAVK